MDPADHHRVPHWETATALGVLDNERAVKISGAMFTMQRGAGATLARALCQYGLDLNADAHEEVRPPSLVSSATLTATGQLPKFADDAYSIPRDDLWCIPTAEVPLTSIYADETLDDTVLPIRMMAFSASYRREAGSAGRDTRGMLRAHEFDKVEILALATPEQAPALLDDMVARAERAIAGLGLTYRIIEICTGDMGQSHHRSYDIEVVRTRRRQLVGGVLDQLVQRLSGAPGEHPVPSSRRRRQAAQGHRVRAHPERVGPGRAAGLGGDHRDLPQRRRIGHGARGAAAVHARHRADRDEPEAVTDWAAPEDRQSVLRDRRVQYETSGLEITDVAADPLLQWERWHAEALDAGVTEPNAMTVATIGTDGIPDARIVLVRGADERGLVFYTNYDGAKSRQLDAAPVAAAVFSWLDLHRQVRLRAHVERVGDDESDAYFASRPRGSQLGAWASPQSEAIDSRSDLEAARHRLRRAVRRRTGATPAELGWVAAGAVRLGVLAGPTEPSARPIAISPGRADRDLVDQSARTVMVVATASQTGN